MNPQYIIVQAGGKGTRMEHLTANKPKALVPIGNRPMLFHLFEKYPDKQFYCNSRLQKRCYEKVFVCICKGQLSCR